MVKQQALGCGASSDRGNVQLTQPRAHLIFTMPVCTFLRETESPILSPADSENIFSFSIRL